MGTPVTASLITFGSPSADYSDWFAMIDGMQSDPGDRRIILSKDLTLRNVGSHSTTPIGGSSALSVTFNGFSITVDSTVEPDGRPGIGNVITNIQNSTMFAFNAVDSSGRVTIKDQYVIQASVGSGYSFAYLFGLAVWSTKYNIWFTIQNCVHDANSSSSCFFYATSISNTDTPTAKIVIKECKGWDYKFLVVSYGGDYLDALLNSYNTNEDVIVENNTFSGDQKYFCRISNAVLRNNVCSESGFNTVACIQSGTVTGGNATTDSTGNVGLRDIVPSEQFQSVVDTEETYLVPKKSSVLRNGGITPQYVTDDIAGLAIPYHGMIPSGCHVVPVSSSRIYGPF